MDNSRFLKLRLREKYSVDELASLLDVPVDKIRDIESDKVQPTAEVLKKYALLFDVSVDYLMGMAETTQIKNGRTEKSVKAADRKPIFSRWWFLPFPIGLVLMILFMAFPCYKIVEYDFSLFNLFFSDDGGCIAIGVLFLIFAILVACYSVVVMILNNKTLAKMNLANAIVYAVFGVCELILVIVFNAYLGATNFIQFCGVMSYIVWYAISVYAIVIGIYMLYQVCNPESQKHDKHENDQKKVEEQEKNAKEKQERKKQRENKLANCGFMTSARFLMLLSIPLAAVQMVFTFTALLDSSSGAAVTACSGAQIGIWFLVIVFSIVFISLNEKSRIRMILPINILNAVFVLSSLVSGFIMMFSSESGTFVICGLMTIICAVLQSYVWLLNIRKKGNKEEK